MCVFNKPELDTVFEGRDGDGVPELREVTNDPLELMARELQVVCHHQESGCHESSDDDKK